MATARPAASNNPPSLARLELPSSLPGPARSEYGLALVPDAVASRPGAQGQLVDTRSECAFAKLGGLALQLDRAHILRLTCPVCLDTVAGFTPCAVCALCVSQIEKGACPFCRAPSSTPPPAPSPPPPPTTLPGGVYRTLVGSRLSQP